MNTKQLIPIVITIFACNVLPACDRPATTQEFEVLTMIPNTQLANETNTYMAKDTQALADVIKSLGKIISNESDFKKEKSVLGEVKLADSKALLGKSNAAGYRKIIGGKKEIWGIFRRKDNASFWGYVELSPFYPGEDIQMYLTPQFYEHIGLVLERSVQTSKYGSSMKISNLFYYRYKEGNPRVRFLFESDPAKTNISDGYPKSFFNFEIDLADPIPHALNAPNAQTNIQANTATIAQARPQSLKAYPGEACPKSGRWYSPHFSMGSSIWFDQGKPMPGHRVNAQGNQVVWYHTIEAQPTNTGVDSVSATTAPRFECHPAEICPKTGYWVITYKNPPINMHLALLPTNPYFFERGQVFTSLGAAHNELPYYVWTWLGEHPPQAV